MPRFTRRQLLFAGLSLTAAAVSAAPLRRKVFDVTEFGAVGDGMTLDTVPLQRAVDAASAAGAGSQVLLRGGRRYLIGALQLKSNVDFHLADDAEILVSTDPRDYGGRAAIWAEGAHGLRISGTGSINGRSPDFMDHYDAAGEWWRPKGFRPRLVVLAGCTDLEIRDVTLRQAPSWTLHLLGCENVLVEGVQIRNQLDVPNCDGIDPDHCRNLSIRKCHIVCGDDAIVIKTTAGANYGPSSHIRVSDCILETQDAGLKIGTETTQDIRDVVFERCEIRTSSRGICIQLRDEGDIAGIEFRDIRLVSRYYSAPWWGRGEAISLTAIPRAPGSKIGTLSGIRMTHITGRAENSVRIQGSAESRVRDVTLERVAMTFERWTKYPGGMWDNRPTTAEPALEPHGTPAFSVRHADRVALKDCRARWGDHVPDYFTHALEAQDASVTYPGFIGTAAHPGRDQAIIASLPLR